MKNKLDFIPEHSDLSTTIVKHVKTLFEGEVHI